MYCSIHPHLHLLETTGRSGKPMAVLPPKEMKPLKHTFLTVDQVERILDRYGDAVKELEYELRDLFEYNRLVIFSTVSLKKILLLLRVYIWLVCL